VWDQESISIAGDVRTLHGGHLVVLTNAPPVNRSLIERCLEASSIRSKNISVTNRLRAARKFSFVNLYPCVTGLPDPDRLFCCGVDKNCCADNFTMAGGVPFAPALVQESDYNASSLSLSISSLSPTSGFTSAVVSSTPISTSTLCADHSNGPSTVTVGSAVGASLGGLLLAFLILFIFRERHWRNKAHYIQMESEKRAWELQQLNGKVGATENAYPFHRSPSEMPTDQYLMVEAPTMTDPQEVSGHSSLPKRTVV